MEDEEIIYNHDELFTVFKALNIIIGADLIDGTH